MKPKELILLYKFQAIQQETLIQEISTVVVKLGATYFNNFSFIPFNVMKERNLSSSISNV